MNLADKKAIFVKTLSVKAAEDDGNCGISGLALISCDEILLADCNNDCVKILNVRESKISSRYSSQPPSKPWDVAVINEEIAAATMPEKGEIIFMDTTNGLSKSHTLKIRKGCRGIDHQNGIIVVSFCSSPAVQILNMKGKILNEVSDASIFVAPSFVAFSKDSKSIYVSDYLKHAVYELRLDGEVKTTTKCWKDNYPRGLAVASDGTVVVCCENTWDRLTLLMSNTGEIRYLTVEHVEEPTAFLLYEEQNKIVLCGSDSDCNEMKIFDLR
ncbi:uncharacterized protein LOC128559258 [Mercenaria mercenaria]|uniref:uncharacterized protein LOC128559258 n=1 Tax=Mercenaria mercenaria TaxID=6596 RepID=UPI00234FB166|nr:uncharacterized protein LOC128559258 [Mercenaria mercenaria]